MIKEGKPPWLILGNLKRVGPEKPLGYDPIQFLEHAANEWGIPVNVYQEELIKNLEERGLRIRVFAEDECDTIGGAIYAYHPQALGNLLYNNRKTLQFYGWPQEVAQFVESVAVRFAKPPSPMFDLIADAFADRFHHERQKIAQKVWHRTYEFVTGTLI